MALPTQMTEPKTELSDTTILIHTPPKGGKSSMAAQFPDALFLATEPGLGAIKCYQQPINSWAELLDACKDIAAGNHRFRTIVLDTADNAWIFCREHVCKRLGISDPADAPFGKGFAAVRQEWHRVLTRLASLPYGLIITSHSREKEIETRTGKITKWGISLPESASEVLTALVDIILFGDIEVTKDANGKSRERMVLRTKPSIHYDAGDRFGRLPETIDFSYDALLKAWTQGGKK